MKQLLIVMCSFLLLGLLSCLTGVTTSLAAVVSDSYLSYTGKNQQGAANFVLKSDDLLANFKEVMPGDQVQQRLFLKNESSETTVIDLAIVTTDLLDEEFLQQLELRLVKKGTLLYEGKISQMTKNKPIRLGELKKGDEQLFELQLKVPLDLANQYNGYQTESVWTFIATEEPEKIVKPIKPQKPTKSDKSQSLTPPIKQSSSGSRPNLPQTGEQASPKKLLNALSLGLVIMASYLIFKKKQHGE